MRHLDTTSVTVVRLRLDTHHRIHDNSLRRNMTTTKNTVEHKDTIINRLFTVALKLKNEWHERHASTAAEKLSNEIAIKSTDEINQDPSKSDYDLLIRPYNRRQQSFGRFHKASSLLDLPSMTYDTVDDSLKKIPFRRSAKPNNSLIRLAKSPAIWQSTVPRPLRTRTPMLPRFRAILPLGPIRSNLRLQQPTPRSFQSRFR